MISTKILITDIIINLNLTVGGRLQLAFWPHPSAFQTASPLPWNVPGPVRTTLSTCSNKNHSGVGYPLGGAMIVPWTSTVTLLLHGPAKITGPAKKSPLGTSSVAGTGLAHTWSHVFRNACRTNFFRRKKLFFINVSCHVYFTNNNSNLNYEAKLKLIP